MAPGNRDQSERLHELRHSTAHVMADAVLDKFPGGKLAFGPPIENGFYYDFDLPRALTPEDLEEIEERMKAIVKGNYAFEHRDLGVEEAKAMFADQPYKIDQIEKLASGEEDEHGEAGAEPVSDGVAKIRSTVNTLFGTTLLLVAVAAVAAKSTTTAANRAAVRVINSSLRGGSR